MPRDGVEVVYENYFEIAKLLGTNKSLEVGVETTSWNREGIWYKSTD